MPPLVRKPRRSVATWTCGGSWWRWYCRTPLSSSSDWSSSSITGWSTPWTSSARPRIPWSSRCRWKSTSWELYLDLVSPRSTAWWSFKWRRQRQLRRKLWRRDLWRKETPEWRENRGAQGAAEPGKPSREGEGRERVSEWGRGTGRATGGIMTGSTTGEPSSLPRVVNISLENKARRVPTVAKERFKRF